MTCVSKSFVSLLLLMSVVAAQGQSDAYMVVSWNKDLSLSAMASSIRRDERDPQLVWVDLRLTSKAKFFLPKTPHGHKWRTIDMRSLVSCGAEPKLWTMESYARDSDGRTVEQHLSQDRAEVTPAPMTPGSLNAIAVSWICARAPEKPASPQLSAQAASSPSEEATASVRAGKPLGVPHATSASISGTAFSVSHAGFLLTNNHVINGCESVTLTTMDGRQETARIAFRDERNDLALLATKAPLSDIAVFRRTPIRSGEDVIALGFPYRGLLATDVNVSTGIVSAMAGIRNDSSRLQISAPVQPGNSGGPLIDHKGAVVGVVVAKLDALVVAKAIGDIPQNINFAIKAEPAISFLRSSGIEPAMASNTAKNLEIADSVQTARRYTYLVECVATLQAEQ